MFGKEIGDDSGQDDRQESGGDVEELEPLDFFVPAGEVTDADEEEDGADPQEESQGVG